eukprot:Pgem_evm1s14350
MEGGDDIVMYQSCEEYINPDYGEKGKDFKTSPSKTDVQHNYCGTDSDLISDVKISKPIGIKEYYNCYNSESEGNNNDEDYANGFLIDANNNDLNTNFAEYSNIENYPSEYALVTEPNDEHDKDDNSTYVNNEHNINH